MMAHVESYSPVTLSSRGALAKVSKFGFKNYLFALPWFIMLVFMTLTVSQSNVTGRTHMQGGSFNQIVVGMAFLGAFIVVWLKFKQTVSILNGRWTYVFFVAYILASVQWSSDPGSTLRMWAYYVGTALTSLAAAIAYRGNATKFFQTLAAYSFFMIGGSLILVWQYPWLGIGVSDPATGLQSPGRWNGVSAHANGLGTICLISVWANVACFFLTRSNLIKLLNVSALFGSAICLYGANSVTSIVLSTLVAGTMAAFAPLDRLKGRTVVLISFSAVISVLVVYIFKPEAFNLDFWLEPFGRDSSFTGRVTIWAHAMASFFDRPLLGGGFQEFIYFGGREIKHLHNGYLDLVLRGGLIAILFLVILVAQIFRSVKKLSKKNIRISMFIFAMVMVILVHNITEGSFGRGATPLWSIFSFLYFFAHSEAKILKTST